MSARPTVVVRCDWPGCYSKVDTHFGRVIEARRWAAKQGWKRLAGGVDVCGSPERAEYSPDGLRWNNHAARTDHAPLVKPSRKGYAKLSCSCGWQYVSPYSWYPEGAASRGMVAHYWAEHVKEAEAKAKAAGPASPQNG